MHILKIKNQFNTIFIFIMILALLSFFTTNYFVNKVSSSYDAIIDNSLPIMNKTSHVAQLTAQIEAHLIQLHFDAINYLDKREITASKINELIILWREVKLLLEEFQHIPNVDKTQLQQTNKVIEDYLEQMPQLLTQINLFSKAKKIEQEYNVEIETIINYNNKILLAEMDSFWHEIIKIIPSKKQLAQLEYANDFYKNSTQLLSYFRQTLLTKDVHTLNILKRNSVKLYMQMRQLGSAQFEYQLFANTLLSKVKHLYAGENSLFKVRYDVLRLENITNALIQQQIQMAQKIEKISDKILLQEQNALAQKKLKISQDLFHVNQYTILIIIVSFIISFCSVWFLVNQNLIKRITTIRSKILELSHGNTGIEIKTYKNDEIGDMEDALTQLKGYVVKAKLLSTTDSLTGLLNHTQFKENLKIEIKRHTRQKQPLSLAILDIDYFKNYNDCYGHPKGDECLKKISTLIKQVCQRAGDSAYRIGGEEFAILMPNTTAKQQYNKLLLLQHNVKQYDIEHKYSDVSPIVTLSIGIYSSNIEQETDADQYYKKADKALYEAKKNRNNIIIYKDHAFASII